MSVRLSTLLVTAFAVALTVPGFAQTGQPPAVGEPTAGWTRRGDTGVTPFGAGTFAFGVQYRLVYDGSNLPGPGATTADDTASYDFFRQRVRLNLEAAPNESVGAFVQAEFRGGWGRKRPWRLGSPRRRTSAQPLQPHRRPWSPIHLLVLETLEDATGDGRDSAVFR